MRTPGMLLCLVGLLLGWTVRAGAQGPSSGDQFESLPAPVLECTLPECGGMQSERRSSRLGRSVLAGALIGAGVGVLTGALAYEYCTRERAVSGAGAD